MYTLFRSLTSLMVLLLVSESVQKLGEFLQSEEIGDDSWRNGDMPMIYEPYKKSSGGVSTHIHSVMDGWMDGWSLCHSLGKFLGTINKNNCLIIFLNDMHFGNNANRWPNTHFVFLFVDKSRYIAFTVYCIEVTETLS